MNETIIPNRRKCTGDVNHATHVLKMPTGLVYCYVLLSEYIKLTQWLPDITDH
jgi:hypothetical protein